MTLKEKFYPYCDNEYSDKWVSAEYCEDVADEFAVGFAEYCLKFDNLKNESTYLIEQLLKIYKKTL